jgi:ABC-2 type transport system ATP-binding protein
MPSSTSHRSSLTWRQRRNDDGFPQLFQVSGFYIGLLRVVGWLGEWEIFYNHPMTTPAIRTENLTRTYRKGRKGFFRKAPPEPEFVALSGVNLEVQPGELFGLLGPNGAGKTTLIKILTTLLSPTSGRAWVDGLDVVEEATTVRPKINMVSGGESSGYGILTVEENLWLFSRIYGVPNADFKARLNRLLEVVGLNEKIKSRVSHLSTGQRQKMNFCRGFLTDPKILFLDEPTLGLDVTAARAIRGFVKEWIAERAGRTLLLTTHYMAEADELCDRLAIIDRGKVLACDTPANLKRQVQEYPMFTLTLAPGAGGLPKLTDVAGVHQVTMTESPTTVEVKVALKEEPAIGAVVQSLVMNGTKILNLAKVEPSLEDVFLELVGRRLSTEVPH